MSNVLHLKAIVIEIPRSLYESLKDGEGGTACYEYGSVSGCDEHCPGLNEGECPNVGEVLYNLTLDKDTLEGLMSLYL